VVFDRRGRQRGRSKQGLRGLLGRKSGAKCERERGSKQELFHLPILKEAIPGVELATVITVNKRHTVCL